MWEQAKKRTKRKAGAFAPFGFTDWRAFARWHWQAD